MAPLCHLMQAEEMPWYFDAVSQCGSRFLRFIYYLFAFAFPLPAATPIECFGVDLFPSRFDIDPHLAWTRSTVGRIDGEVRIDNMQIDRNRLDPLDRLTA